MRNKKLRYGGNGMIAAVVLVMTVMVLLSGCEQTAPVKEVDTYEELADALSGPEDFDIILPDTESLGAIDLEHSLFKIDLYNQDRRVHTGYSISTGIKGLSHLRSCHIFSQKPGYLTFAGSVPQDEEPLDPNMEYAGVPIQFYIGEWPSEIKLEAGITSQGEDDPYADCYSISLGYRFDMNGCRYQLSCVMDIPESDLLQKDAERDMAKEILYEITKNIIDKGMQQSNAVDSEEQ
jgi:hypothetical protein